MLAPIPKGRKDGQSSFEVLTEYLLSRVDLAVDRIDSEQLLLSENLLSWASIPSEMQAVSCHNSRCQDPVYHYILSWPASEQPTCEQWQSAAKYSLKELGFTEHQYLAVAHDNTDNFHIHLMVNRVHPETHRAHYPEWSKRSLDKVCRELEHRYGWQEEKGLFRWDSERNCAVPVEKQLAQEIQKPVSRGAVQTEQYADCESLERFCKGEPKEDLKRCLRQEHVTWDKVHQTLAKHDLALIPGDKGGFVVQHKQSELTVKASTVFRQDFSGKANRQRITELLGPYQAPAIIVLLQQPEKTYKVPVKPIRDPQQTQERANARAQLKKDFAMYKEQSRQAQQLHRKQLSTLNMRFKGEKQNLRWISDPLEKRKRRTLLHLETLMAKNALNTQKPSASLPYKDWLAAEANRGNSEAIRALRGIYYQEKRAGKKVSEAKEEQEPAITGEQKPVIVLPRQDQISWRVQARTGAVTYSADGKELFTDTGTRLRFSQESEEDKSAILLGLQLALQQYGSALEVTGSAAFKQQVQAVAKAANLPVRFKNEELQTNREVPLVQTKTLPNAVINQQKQKGLSR